ncbi:MAG TPA: DUF692 domain-containing protein [Planctomycetes bacterium]|nr:DUF692 domain-containing protein [Planctomycetota bacterium]
MEKDQGLRPGVCPGLGVGLGFRRKHAEELLRGCPEVDWLEILPENSIDRGGLLARQVREAAERYPVAFHGISLNLGSTDPLDFEYLARLKKYVHELGGLWVSDHLCFTGVGDQYLGELLPLPYTEEAAAHVAGRVRIVQDYLELPFLVENVSCYFEYQLEGKLPEWEFVRLVLEEGDCGMLLDVNNVFVNSWNHGFSSKDYLDGIPFERVGQMHMAGHEVDGRLLLDTHGEPIVEKVWDLYEDAVGRCPQPVSILLERDFNIPELEELLPELRRIGEVLDRSFPGGRFAKGAMAEEKA